MTLLVVTDEKYEKEKLANLVNDLSLKGLKLANNLTQVKTIISEIKNNINLIIINSPVESETKYYLDGLSSFSNSFKGQILVKVEDERFGIKLMKEGLINDFYVSSSDKNLEFERLKKAFRIATLRSRVSTTISEIKNSITTLEKMTKEE